MKKLIFAIVAALTGFCSPAWALTYNDQDLLLVFRGVQNDVLFDLGSVNTYLHQTAGTVLPVSGFDINLVKTKNGGSLAGVQVILMAAHNNGNATLWLTDADAAAGLLPAMPAYVAGQAGMVAEVGSTSQAYSTDGTQTYAVPVSDASSYTFLTSGGVLPSQGGTPEKWNGGSDFTVETGLPGVLPFYQLQGYAAPLEVGAFSIDASGSLTFVTGAALPPVITLAPVSQTVDQGSTATFSVSAIGTSLAYQWSVNGTNIDNATSATYSISGVQPTDENTYTVTITNLLGSVSADVDLLVNTVLPPPAQSQIQQISSLNGTNSLSFTTVSGVSYRVHYSPVLGPALSTWAIVGSPVLGDGSTLTVQDVCADATRFYAIEAYRAN